jgi:hypothetical protein
MIADLNTVPVFQPEADQSDAATILKPNLLVNVWLKIKQFCKWINPKNWFKCFSNVEIDMSEFL